MTIGNNIKMARIARGWRQDELAKESGLSKNSISKYETDTVMPRMPQAKAIAKALGIEYEELAGLTPEIEFKIKAKAENMTEEEIAHYKTSYIGAVSYQYNDNSADINERMVRGFTRGMLQDRIDADLDKLSTLGMVEAARDISNLTKIPEYRMEAENQDFLPPLEK